MCFFKLIILHSHPHFTRHIRKKNLQTIHIVHVWESTSPQIRILPEAVELLGPRTHFYYHARYWDPTPYNTNARIMRCISLLEVATNTDRHSFSSWAKIVGKNNRRISTFHSTGGALCLSLCRSFLWILYTFIGKDVNESQNVRVSKKILVLENLISRRARNSRTHKAKLHD